MRWLEQLQQARFRGVPFWVDSATDYVGREKVVREYPFQDWPTVQDMGGVSKPSSFPAYVHGDDVFEQRDALVRAFNKPGAGDLIHPWLGLLRVQIIGPVAMRHSTAEGGVVRFDIEFVRVPVVEQRYPKAVQNTARKVKQTVLQARLKAIEDFAKKYSVENLAGWATENGLGAVTQAVSDIRGTLDTLISVPAGYLAAVDTQFRLFGNTLSDLSPLNLGGGVMGLISSLSDFSLSSGSNAGGGATVDRTLLNSTLQRHQTLFNWSANYEPSPFQTPTRVQESANFSAIETLVQTGAVLSAAELISTTDFPESWNYVEAMQWRATLNNAFQQLLNVVDSSVYQDMLEAMTAVSEDIVTRSRHLGRVSALQLPHATQSALLVSYRHYGVLDYADEIVSNNHIQHPLFIPAGSVLKVISHEA